MDNTREQCESSVWKLKINHEAAANKIEHQTAKILIIAP
jgi:hypothetical protein